MTNFEKYKESILEFMEEHEDLYPAVVDGQFEQCAFTLCEKCDLRSIDHKVVGCRAADFLRWLIDECVEKQKLTRRQRAFCEAVGTGWMARDGNDHCDNLYIHPNKPSKNRMYAVWESSEDIFCQIESKVYPDFPFIKWEDDEPYSIEEMLKWEVEDE